MILGETEIPDNVLRLAFKKCNMNLENTLLMVTSEESINDL
jgi:hypothetical protein